MSEKAPTVSVIIPTYNRARLVGRAIRSVLHQTHQQFEIIVVDDASTDNTEEVVNRFNDPRVRYLRQERNRGGSAARNTGIKAAYGEYVALLDSDDEWLPIHLHRKLQLMQEAKVDGIIGSYYVVSGNRWGKRECRPKPPTMPMAEYILSGVGDARTSTMMFRRLALSEILFDETLRKHQDWDLAIRFERSFSITVDPVATVILYEDPPDRMSKVLNHAATRRFLKSCWTSLSHDTRARFCLLLAVRTLVSEGRSENFREWLRISREVRPRRVVFKGLLVALSIPLLERFVSRLLSSYFSFRHHRATQKLTPSWRRQLG